MNASELIQRLQQVPHVPGMSNWHGADCWGVCVLWYRHRLGIELTDRGEIDAGPSGLSEGFTNKTDWLEIDCPQNDDLVVMRAAVGRRVLAHGHIGVFWNGGVLHSEESSGCVWQPIKARQIANRITCFLRHRSLA